MTTPTLAEIDAALAEAAVGPKSVTVVDTTTIARDIDDLIKARQSLAAGSAFAAGGCGIRFFRVAPPGAG
jgi:hypothetical protein